MNLGKRMPRKVWLLLALALLIGLSPSVGSWTALFGTKKPRDAFLDAVAADWAKDPRLNVARVDHESGRILVRVKPTGVALVLSVIKMEPKTLPDGHVLQQWEFEWKDESGKVIGLGRGSGVETSAVHVSVPGLQ
jgi:hypothetical protein